MCECVCQSIISALGQVLQCQSYIYIRTRIGCNICMYVLILSIYKCIKCMRIYIITHVHTYVDMYVMILNTM